RLRRLYISGPPGRSVRGVAFERAAQAVRPAAPAAELRARYRDHLDALLAQAGVGVHVAVVGDHYAGLEREHVVALVVLLALGAEGIAAGLDHPDVVERQRLLHGVDHAPAVGLHDGLVGLIAGADRPHLGAVDHVG